MLKKNDVRMRGRLRAYLYLPVMLTPLLIMINIPVYMQSVKSGFVVTGFVLLYFLITLVVYLRNKPLLIEELVNFATQYATVQKQLLNEFEIPYALLDFHGKILWVNKQFTEITGKSKNYHKSITTIFPMLTKELLQRGEMAETMKLPLGDRSYRVSMRRLYFDIAEHGNLEVSLEESSEYMTAIYLFDETELERYMQENEDQRLVAGLVYIDNYDEALDSIEDVKRSLLTALIDRKVNNYFSEIDALVRKIDRDKYFIVFKNQYMKQLQEDRFSLIEDVKTVKVGNEMAVTLSIGIGNGGDKYFIVFKNQYMKQLQEDRFSLIEDVKTVKVGNEMAVTLSIGIGNGGDSYNQKYEYARMSIDLALGRGGDQVVVRDGEEITYYGGKNKQVERNSRVKARVKAHANKQVERNSRVKARVKAHALREVIISREHVMIMGHSISDVDSLGAAIGVYCAARVLGKKAQIVLNEVTSSLRPLVEGFSEENGYPADLFIRSEEAIMMTNRNTLVVVVDVNRPSYTECPELLQRTDTVS